MFLTLKTVMVTSVAVGGLATGVAGASPPHGSDVVRSVTAAAAEEAQLHAAVDGLKGTESQLTALLADHLASPTSAVTTLVAPVGAVVTSGAPASVVQGPSANAPSGATPQARSAPSPGPTSYTGGHSGDGAVSGLPDTTEPRPPTTTMPPTTVPPTTTSTTTRPPVTTTTSTRPPVTTTTTTRPRPGGGND